MSDMSNNITTAQQLINSFASSVENANRISAESANTAMRFNAAEAQKNRDWQEMMSNTAHQREVADLVKSGLNPVLSANNGASVGSGAQASTTSYQGQQDNLSPSKVALMQTILQTAMNNQNAKEIAQAQMENAIQQTNLNNATTLAATKISGQFGLSSSNVAASASRYASNKSYDATKYANDMAKDIAAMNNATSERNANVSAEGQDWLNRLVNNTVKAVTHITMAKKSAKTISGKSGKYTSR